MRRFFHRGLPRVRAWWVLPFALLTLPNCAQIIGLEEWHDPVTDPGSLPTTSVIFCDIQQPPGRHCASQAEKDMGIRLEEAATALVSGQGNPIGLDYSQDALSACNGEPQAIPFQANFPDGYPGCLNCSQIGKQYGDARAFCVSTCLDLAPNSGICGDADAVNVATNFAPSSSACFDDACLDEGTLLANFDDPRRHPDPVPWQDKVGVAVGADGSLERQAPFTNNFDAGADSDLIITHGNAYVEFTATETDTARLCGFSQGAPNSDNDVPTLGWAIDLFKDGFVYIFESGTKITGPDMSGTTPGSFGPYSSGEVFRVTVKDNLDGTGPFKPMGGTATVVYSRLTGSCTDGHVCPEDVLYTSLQPAQYPIRIDATLRELGATLTKVRVTRIK